MSPAGRGPASRGRRVPPPRPGKPQRAPVPGERELIPGGKRRFRGHRVGYRRRGSRAGISRFCSGSPRLFSRRIRPADGNITKAATRLGLQPAYLHRLIRNLELRTELAELGS